MTMLATQILNSKFCEFTSKTTITDCLPTVFCYEDDTSIPPHTRTVRTFKSFVLFVLHHEVGNDGMVVLVEVDEVMLPEILGPGAALCAEIGRSLRRESPERLFC
eukprot:6477247-Amphidinium_carterae.1